MQAIKAKLGNIALSIVADVRKEKQAEAVKLAVASAVYRAGGSKLFPSNGKGHKRDEGFSAELAADAEIAIRDALKDVFDVQSIECSAYVAPEKSATVSKAVAAERQKLHDSLKGLLDADVLQAQFPELYEAAELAEAASEEVETIS